MTLCRPRTGVCTSPASMPILTASVRTFPRQQQNIHAPTSGSVSTTTSTTPNTTTQPIQETDSNTFVLDNSFVESCTTIEGVFFSRLFQKSLHVCARHRLEYMAILIQGTGTILQQASTKVGTPIPGRAIPGDDMPLSYSLSVVGIVALWRYMVLRCAADIGAGHANM